MSVNLRVYQDLKSRFRRAGIVNDVLGLLDWDQATMMPDGSAVRRADQIAELKVIRHELLTVAELPAQLAAARDELTELKEDDEHGWHLANLDLMAHAHAHAVAVPDGLVAAEARAASACELAWRDARAAKDFARLVPHLNDLLMLAREVAAAKGDALALDPYDALLDQFERGARVSRIAPLFDELEGRLPNLVGDAVEAQRSRPAPLVPAGPFCEDRQRQLARTVMSRIGFDFERGRLDTSHHPFCGGSRDDIRITTRYDRDDFMSALMAVVHETGHALYELGLPEAFVYQPVGSSGGMALHESQSLAMEMQACRSHAFFVFLAPLARETFGGTGPAWEPDNLHRLATRVVPSYIRVDADEITYPAHILLRTRLERAMIAGDLAVAELPGAWNDGMRALLGLTPPDDALGCLQDIHWPSGAFGYFPTYTMGAIAAAQLFAALRQDHPRLDDELSRGEFDTLVSWLLGNVHSYGSVTDTDGILMRATGRALDLAAFTGHLEHRYLT